MGLILTSASALQQFTVDFSMGLAGQHPDTFCSFRIVCMLMMGFAAELQQLTLIGVYVAFGAGVVEALDGVQQLADELLLATIWRSNPRESRTMLARTETPAAIIAYNNVTFQPKVIHISPTIMGLSSGETNKKVRVGPNPAFADNNPRNIGIVEQLQNGVTAPNKAARR